MTAHSFLVFNLLKLIIISSENIDLWGVGQSGHYLNKKS